MVSTILSQGAKIQKTSSHLLFVLRAGGFLGFGTEPFARPVSGPNHAQVVLTQPLEADGCGGQYGLGTRHRNRVSF